MLKVISSLPTHVLALKELKYRDKVLRLACVNGVTLILRRIQHKHENSKGEKFSPYSKQYAKIRTQAGRQVANKDLTMTGQMTDNFKAMPIGNNAYGLGFDNEFANQKAEWQEAQNGELFVPSVSENAVILQSIENYITKILNKNNL